MIIKERMVSRNNNATWKRARELRRLSYNGCQAINHLCSAVAFCSDSDATLREAGADYTAIRKQALLDCLAILVEAEDRYVKQDQHE